jgi:hypothetical protein
MITIVRIVIQNIRYEWWKFFINSQIIAFGFLILITSIIGNNSIEMFAKRLFESPQNSRIFAELSLPNDSFYPKNLKKEYKSELIEYLNWNSNTSTQSETTDSTFSSLILSEMSLYDPNFVYSERPNSAIPVFVSLQVLANFDNVDLSKIGTSIERYNTLKSLRDKYIGKTLDLYVRNVFLNQKNFEKTLIKIYIQNTLEDNTYLIAFPKEGKSKIMPIVDEYKGSINDSRRIFELSSRDDLAQFYGKGGEAQITSLKKYQNDLEAGKVWIQILGYLFFFISIGFISNIIFRLYADSLKNSSIFYSIGISEWKIYLINTTHSLFQVISGIFVSILYSYLLLVILSLMYGNNVINIMLNYVTRFDIQLPTLVFVNFPPLSLLYLIIFVSFVVCVQNSLLWIQNSFRNPIENLKY